MSDSFVTLWAVACQAALTMGFPKREYWSGLPFPSPEDLTEPGIEPESPVLQAASCITAGFFTTEPPGKPVVSQFWVFMKDNGNFEILNKVVR